MRVERVGRIERMGHGRRSPIGAFCMLLAVRRSGDVAHWRINVRKRITLRWHRVARRRGRDCSGLLAWRLRTFGIVYSMDIRPS